MSVAASASVVRTRLAPARAEKQRPNRRSRRLDDQARRREPAHERGVSLRIEQDERQGPARDRMDAVAGAIEDQCQGDEGRARKQQPDAGGSQHRPDRVMPVAADQHLGHARADL
ncbi:MAG: hypothetical protein E5W56_06310 [Mesorhizobium sp.]|nr:MAG: hypothetical protein E5W57_07095 [Mesorhizobium sp.]TIT82181.1 MAG: hypothetical protein E5W56_06310 [Mesorhizobium sp.]